MLFETNLIYPGAFIDADGGKNVKSLTVVENVEYTSADGTRLVGRLRDCGSKSVVLFLHGNGEKAAWLDPWVSRLSDAFDANVLAAEYRGFAGEGSPFEVGVIADCEAARAYLCQRYGLQPADVILYGRSLGGGCAVALAASGGARALVLERTFDRLVDVAAGRYPLVPIRLLMRNQFDSISRIRDYDGPLVQVHGTSDWLIPIQHAENLFAASQSEKKSWIAVPDLGHNGRLPEEVLRQIVEGSLR